MDLSTTAVDIDAERSVLGALLLESDRIDSISFLEERDFSSQHRQIFKVIKFMTEQEKPVDLVTVTQEYMNYNRLDDVGGVQYLAKLTDSVPSTANIEYYAKIVRSKAVRRRGIESARKLEALSEADFNSDDEYFAAAEALIDEMRPKESGKMKSLKEIRTSYFKHLKEKVTTIPTGFSKFDSWSGGLGKGTLFISAGRPSVGKTALLLQRIIGISKPVSSGVILIYSQEMDDTELLDRMVANMTGISYVKILRKELDDFQMEQVNVAYEKLEKKLIFINDAAGVSIHEIKAEARRMKKKYGKIDLIAVDYLQIMHIPQEKGESRALAIGRVTTAAKHIARNMKCPFMMLSQMNRESENRKKPQLSDLKESSSIEQDADVVEFLWWDQNDTNPNGKVIQQFIAKGRSIGINEFRLLFKGWKQHFTELEDKE